MKWRHSAFNNVEYMYIHKFLLMFLLMFWGTSRWLNGTTVLQVIFEAFVAILDFGFSCHGNVEK